MPNPHNLAVGQKLWFHSRVSVRYRSSHEVTISKIGSRWATIDNDRISLETLEMDGGGYSSPGQCWISKEACDLAQETSAAWDRLRQSIDRTYSHPTSVTLEDIQQVRKQLGFDP